MFMYVLNIMSKWYIFDTRQFVHKDTYRANCKNTLVNSTECCPLRSTTWIFLRLCVLVLVVRIKFKKPCILPFNHCYLKLSVSTIRKQTWGLRPKSKLDLSTWQRTISLGFYGCGWWCTHRIWAFGGGWRSWKLLGQHLLPVVSLGQSWSFW